MIKNIELNLGDKLALRKPHPCGGKFWTVLRTGADVKLKCDECGHVVMLTREACIRAVKQNLGRGQ